MSACEGCGVHYSQCMGDCFNYKKLNEIIRKVNVLEYHLGLIVRDLERLVKDV